MRVLVITPWFPSKSRPGEGIFHLRDAELLAADYEVTVLHLASRELEEDVRYGNISVLRRESHLRSPADYWRIQSLARRLLSHHDLLHTMAFPALIPLSTLRISLPWVHTEHWAGLVRQPMGTLPRLGVRTFRRLLRRPDELVAVGPQLADALQTAGGKAVTEIGNFVRISPAATRLPQPLRADDTIRAVAVGGLRSHKGVREAVEAIAALIETGHSAQLTWAGTGPMLEEMNALARELHVSANVRFVGFQDPSQLSALLLSSNVFLAPTQYETFGVAIAEALGHGLPVVASGEGGHNAFLPPEASRIVERSGSAIAAGVLSLAADVQRWSAEQIREYAAQRFDEDSRRQKYREVYRRAIASRRGSSGQP